MSNEHTAERCDLNGWTQVVSDDHSGHGLPIGAHVEFLWHKDDADWWTQGGDGDEVAIDPRDLRVIPPEKGTS